MFSLYKKSPLGFAIGSILVYCLLQGPAAAFSRFIHMDYAGQAVVNLLLCALVLGFLTKHGLLEFFGICGSTLPAQSFYYYLPLVLICTVNFWAGPSLRLPLEASLCFLVCMLCVGFLEEVLFRGFLFKALEKNGIRQAITISSLSFGLGHILNLFSGEGDTLGNLLQVANACFLGLLLVLIFYRGGSLLPCIAAHAFINMSSLFYDAAAYSDTKRLVLTAVHTLLVLAYTLALARRLPQANKNP